MRHAAPWLAGATVAMAACDRGSEDPSITRRAAEIIHGHCTPCHHAGGSAPFPLVEHRDVLRRARDIATVTASGAMPPWMPERDVGRFADDRSLSDTELALLQDWLAQGAPLDDPAHWPQPPTFEPGWKLGEPDVVLTMPEPYVIPAEGRDVFRSFIVPTDFEEDRWVQAFEFRADGLRGLHHVILRIDEEGVARSLDAGDSMPGFGEEGGLFQGREVWGWVPGTTPRAFPDGTATRIKPGADLLLDMHFQPIGKPETVQMSVGLHLAPEPPVTPSMLIHLTARAINIPPGVRDYQVDASLTLPVPIRVTGIIPHAHFLCTSTEVFAELADGARIDLLRIDDWDFNWQDFYHLAEPVPLPAGAQLGMRYRYDNSDDNPRNSFSPPRRTLAGTRSSDEMGDVWLFALFESEEDLAVTSALVDEHIVRANDKAIPLLKHWRSMVGAFDEDGDGWLDPTEEGRAGTWLEEVRENETVLLDVFDADGNGVLDSEERETALRLIDSWKDGR